MPDRDGGLEANGDETRTEPLPRYGPRPGDVLSSRFRIMKRLGRGGMGEVFEADDSELGGRVALKVIRREHDSDPEFLSRFRREVLLARQVTHPNVCRLFDVGRDEDGSIYFTMELLEGQTLHQLLRDRGKLAPATAFPLIEQMAAGLRALHEQGIVHRDFKPGNVMVVRGATGTTGLRAVITDFGLARATPAPLPEGQPLDSAPSAIAGTPDYMAPEQLMGKVATAASDIYAFGITLYEMMTGKRPFQRLSAIEQAVQRIVEPPMPPRQLAPELPEAWQSAILRCLEREPEKRPSPAEVVEALRGSSLIGRPQPEPPPRRGVLAWAMAAVAAVAAMFGLWRLQQSAPRGPDVAVLPFQVTVAPGAADSALEVFADALMDRVTLGLSKAGITVAAVDQVRSQGVRSAADAKAKLGARATVEGRVSSEGGRIKVEASLIDAAGKLPPVPVTAEDDRANTSAVEDTLVAKLGEAVKARASASPAVAGPGAREFYAQARGYLQRPDQLASLDSAITLSRKALEIDPDFALAHASLGEALFLKYDLTRDPKWVTEAMHAGRKAVELGPRLAETHVGMGRINMGTGRAEEAMKDFQKALSIDSANTDAYQGLGNALAALKRYPEAEAALRRAIALKPGDWIGYKQLGMYFARREELEKAIEQYKTVIALTPDNAHGYVNSGGFYFQKGDLESAKKMLLRAVEIEPSRTSAVTNLAKVYYELGEYPRAIDLYQKAIKLTTIRSYVLWGNLGQAYRRVGREAEARSALAEAIKIAESELMINSESVQARLRLAFYRALLGQHQAAEAALKKALEGAQDKPDLMISAAETYAILGKNDLAVSLARRALIAGYPRKILSRSSALRGLIDRIESK